MTKDGFGFSESEDEERAGRAPQSSDACGRGEELVAYLYGEADAEERGRFELHAGECDACREELAAFRGVRRAVGEWRDEGLALTPAVAFPAPAARAYAGTDAAAAGKPSARAALRAFYALSPSWLRASLAAAALLVCALAALGLAELSWDEGGLAVRTGGAERFAERRVEAPAVQGFTREQVDAIAAERVERALAEQRAAAEPARDDRFVKASGGAGANVEAERSAAGAASRARRRVRTSPAPRVGRPMLVELDDDLPRLSDLLSVAN